MVPLLANADKDLFYYEAWTIAYWTREACKNIQIPSENEAYFWHIIEKIFDAMMSAKLDKNPDNIFDEAINHPLGIMTEALIEHLSKNKPESSNIPEPYLEFMNRIINAPENPFILGRVILASRLSYFYSFYPDWTKKYLLPKFDWKNSPEEAKLMWHGYLHAPNISIDRASELKKSIIKSLKKIKKSDYARQLNHLFTLICLEYPDLYPLEEKQQALLELDEQGLTNVAECIWRIMEANDQRDNYWNNRLELFMKEVWPKDYSLKKPDISKYLALICISLSESFPKAVKIIKKFLVSFTPNSFLNELQLKGTLIQTYPAETFDLLKAIFTPQYSVSNCCFLWEIMKLLLEKAPAIKNDPQFVKIKDFLLHKNFTL